MSNERKCRGGGIKEKLSPIIQKGAVEDKASAHQFFVNRVTLEVVANQAISVKENVSAFVLAKHLDEEGQHLLAI